MSQCVRGRIQGVWLKHLQVFADDRGVLAELARVDDPYFGTDFAGYGQTTLTMSYPGVIKAFHWHKAQDDVWFVSKGMIQAVLYDLREDSPTSGMTEVVCMGEHRPLLLVIPRGVAHGYRVISHEPAWVVYQTSALYDARNPDEERIAWDDPRIGFDWVTRPR
jgi:dTDP-4-dehydrorhamnose 3,5-epimerase